MDRNLQFEIQYHYCWYFRCFGIPLGQIGCRLASQSDMPSMYYHVCKVHRLQNFGSGFTCTEWKQVQIGQISPFSNKPTLGKKIIHLQAFTNYNIVKVKFVLIYSQYQKSECKNFKRNLLNHFFFYLTGFLFSVAQVDKGFRMELVMFLQMQRLYVRYPLRW